MNPKIDAVLAIMEPVQTSPDTPEPVREWLGHLMNVISEIDLPDENYLKGAPLPEGVGNLADLYSFTRQYRLKLEKDATGVKSRETEIYNAIMSILDESTDTGAAGQHYRVQRVEKDRINVTDWDAVWKYIAANDAFDMLQKRINDKAVTDRFGEQLEGAREALDAYLEANPDADADLATKQVQEAREIPGLKAVKVPTLSFTKV